MARNRKLLLSAAALLALAFLVTLGLWSRLPDDAGAPDRPGAEGGGTEQPAVETPDAEPPSPGEAMPAPRIAGVVLGPGGEPAPGATVEDFGLRAALDYEGEKPKGTTVVCDGEGRFAFLEAVAGGHALHARHPALGSGTIPLLRVPPEGTVSVVIRLEPGAEIRGRVVSRDGSPAPGARIATDSGNPLRRLYQVVAGWWFLPETRVETTADEDGRFQLAPLLPGVHDLTVEAAGHARREIKAVVAPGEIVVTLDPGGAICGVVRFEGAEPPEEFRILLIPDGRDEVVPVAAGAEAPFAITGLPPREYEVRVAAAGFTEARADAVVRPGRDADPVRLVLSPGTPVTGFVLDSTSGKPMAGVLVGFLSVEINVLGGSYRRESEQLTDAGGRYTARLRPGTWSCSLRKEGYFTVDGVSDSSIFTVGPEPLERNLPFSPVPGAIIGTVLFADGGPVVGAEVFVIGVSANPEIDEPGPIGISDDMTAVTDEDGRFRLEEGIEPRLQLDLRVTGPGGAKDDRMDVRFKPGAREVEVRFEIPRVEAVGARVTGRIATADGTPVGGAFLVLAGKALASDSEGRFVREKVPPGRYVLTVGALGHATAYSGPHDVAPREPIDLGDIVLRKQGIRIRGSITDARGESVEGACVTVWFHPPSGRSVVLSTFSRADGGYDLAGPDLPGREVTVQVSGRGFVHAEKRVTPEREAVVSFTLEREATVTGSIVFVGTPPREISAFTNGHDRFTSLAIDWDRNTGAFTVLRAKPGPHRLRIRAKGFAPSAYREVVVPDGGSVDFGAVKMTVGGVITGRVLDADGTPIADVQVAVRGDWIHTDTDEEGRFRLAHVPPGSHVLSVNGLEGREESPSFPAEVVEGRETERELRIPR